MNESIEYLSICKDSAIWISLHNPQVRYLLCASSNNKPDSNVRLFINSSKKMIVLNKRILYSERQEKLYELGGYMTIKILYTTNFSAYLCLIFFSKMTLRELSDIS